MYRQPRTDSRSRGGLLPNIDLLHPLSLGPSVSASTAPEIKIRARVRAIVTDTMAANPAPSASLPMSLLRITLTAPESPISSSTPEPTTDSASPGSTVWVAHSGSCSIPSMVSGPAASAWSASRNASISPRRSANSCSNSSARWGNSRHRPSPSGPTTASRRPEDEMGKLGVRRSIRTRFRRRRIPRSRSVAQKDRENSSELAGQRLVDARLKFTIGIPIPNVILGTNRRMTPLRW